MTLLGRASECARIDRIIEAVIAGTSDVVMFTGEAGIGKTALLTYAAARATPYGQVMRASGSRDEAQIPFAALSALLRPFDLDRMDLSGVRRRALGAALALTDTVATPADGLAVGAALLDVFSAAAESRPLFVILDDVHQMDSPTVRVLTFVARRLDRDRVGFVLAARDSHGTVPDLPRLRLSGLDSASATALLSASETGLNPAQLARMVRVTDGNPLALTELPTLLSARARLTAEPEVEPPPIGSVLEDAYGDRIDPLNEPTRHALLMLALLPDVNGTTAFEALRSVGVRPAAFGDAEDARLVTVTPGGVAFRHPLVASAVVQRTSASRRRRAHRLIADAADGERRAWHLAAAAYGPDETVAAALESCAVRATEVAGYASAAAAYERAAQLSLDAPDRWRRLLAAGNAAVTGGQLEHARHLIDQLSTAEPLAATMRGRLVELRGRIDTRDGRPRRAYEQTAAEAERLLPTCPDLAIELLTCAFAAAVFAGLGRDALLVARSAARLAAGSDDAMAGYCRCAVAITETMLGMGGGEAKLDEGFAQLWNHGATPPALRPLLSDVAFGYTIMDRFDRAAELHRAVATFAAEQGSAALMVWPVGEQALIDFRTGQWGKAYAGALEAERLALDAGMLTEVANNRQLITAICAGRGNDADCHRYAAMVLEQAAKTGATVMALLIHGSVGQLHLSLGQMEHAIGSLERAAELSASTGFREAAHFPWAADLAEAYVRRGQADRATLIAEDLEQQARQTRRPVTTALAARVRGLTSPPGTFDDCFDQALRAHADSLRPFERARTQLCYGQRLRRRKNKARARQQLTAAWQTFADLGADAWGRIAHAELTALGVQVAERPMTRAHLLTPQEQQVANLAAAGANNREVAERLFVSRKTVEYHLSHVYRKLGLASRTELKAELETHLTPAWRDGERRGCGWT